MRPFMRPALVSILARLWGRALPCATPRMNLCSRFQSSPGFGAGRYASENLDLSGVLKVSILARLWGRALRCRPCRNTESTCRFNPRPALGPGATRLLRSGQIDTSGFNPRPALGPGATLNQSGQPDHHKRFNPRPALGPGATTTAGGRFRDAAVSILARLWGRALQGPPGRSWPLCLFQSSPGFGAGRYMRDGISGGTRNGFQSSPGFGAGRYHIPPSTSTAIFYFNPRPALGPGATLRPAYCCRRIPVSILARLWGRALRSCAQGGLLLPVFQSSPGFGAGRYSSPRPGRYRICSFNPRPALGPGATAHRQRHDFQR